LRLKRRQSDIWKEIEFPRENRIITRERADTL
jgi:hypothetical protein